MCTANRDCNKEKPMLKTTSCLITVEDVYPGGYEIPKGYIGEFKICKTGDSVLVPVGSTKANAVSQITHTHWRFPRIILTRQMVKVIKFVEQPGKIIASKEDYATLSSGSMFITSPGGTYDTPLYKRIETEEPAE